MAYMAEVLAYRRIKDPVQFYLYTVAKEGYESVGRDFSESLTRGLMENGRSYLATVSAFADSAGITYANKGQTKEEQAHERWHKDIINKGLDSDAGDFIEEATAAVIESVIGGFTDECLASSRKFLKLHKKLPGRSGRNLEKLLERDFVGRRELIYEADKQIMEGSCPWLSYISEAQYYLLYGLCLGVYHQNKNKLRRARRIFRESLQKARDKGVNAGLVHLKQHATSTVADLYDLDLSDIGSYLPSYPKSHQREYLFFDEKLKIEVCYAYKSWLEVVEREIRKRKFK